MSGYDSLNEFEFDEIMKRFFPTTYDVKYLLKSKTREFGASGGFQSNSPNDTVIAESLTKPRGALMYA